MADSSDEFESDLSCESEYKALKVQMNGRVRQVVKKKKWIQIRKL